MQALSFHAPSSPSPICFCLPFWKTPTQWSTAAAPATLSLPGLFLVGASRPKALHQKNSRASSCTGGRLAIGPRQAEEEPKFEMFPRRPAQVGIGHIRGADNAPCTRHYATRSAGNPLQQLATPPPGQYPTAPHRACSRRGASTATFPLPKFSLYAAWPPPVRGHCPPLCTQSCHAILFFWGKNR